MSNLRDIVNAHLYPVLAIFGIAYGAIQVAPLDEQSRNFSHCVNNAQIGIINLSGTEIKDVDGNSGFIERPVAVHYCSGGDISRYVKLMGG